MTAKSLLLILALILAVTSVAAACGGSGSDGVSDNGSPAEDTADPTDAAEPTAAVMAVALHQLVTVDHTFGDGPPPFSHYLVQQALDPAAGSGAGVGGGRPLTESERAAIEAALSPLGPVQFIEDPDEWRTSDLRPTIEGAVIVGVGEPTIEDDHALVPVSLWCGGTCGTWLTYRTELTGDEWTVTGVDGPIAIS